MVRCKHCGEYIEKESAVRVGVSSFCSEEHRLAAMYERFNKNNQKTSRKREVSRVPAQTAERVRKADPYRCSLCGNTFGLALHHINYRSEQSNKPWMNEPWNLITLCNEPCHLVIVHGDKKKFKPLLLGLTWLREVYGDASMSVYQLQQKLLET